MIPALIAAGASIYGAKQRNKAAQKAASNQMSFQKNMSNTSYQRGMEDMKKAGLNPILAGKMGGASTPGGATYQPENVGMAAQQSFANVANVMANTAKIKEETKILKRTAGSILGKTGLGIRILNGLSVVASLAFVISLINSLNDLCISVPFIYSVRALPVTNLPT